MSRVILCPNCNKEKEYYCKGLCKPCYQRHWREKNPDYARQWRKRNPRKRKAYCRVWREKNAEQIAIYSKQYRERNREILCIRTRRFRQSNPDYYPNWWKNNPEKLAGQKARRRAREWDAANTLTHKQIEFEKKIGEATYPDEKLHLHHLVPLSKGGGHTWGNIAFIPSSLNLSIQDKLPEEVYIQVGLGI